MSAAAWKGFAVIPTAHRQVLLSAWQANRSRGAMWFLGLVGLLLALLPVVLWWLTPDHSLQASFEAMVSVSVVAIISLWGVLVNNVLLQNHPHTARLLPAQVPVLRNTLLGMAALLCALTTLLSWLAGGPVLGVAAGMAVGLASLALCLRWLWPWIFVTMLAWVLPYLGARGELEGAAALWRTAPTALTLLALALATLALRAVVMTGNARHEQAHASLLLISTATRGQFPGASSQSLEGLVGWFLKRVNCAYFAWMGHLLAQARPKVISRLALGLGPQAHWTTLVAGQTIGLLMLVLACVLLAIFPDWKATQYMALGALVGQALSGLTAVTPSPAALWASRREQALLCLLPGAPQGARLNRWLAWRLAGTALANIALLIAAVLVLGRFANTPAFGDMPSEMTLSMLMLEAPMVFLLWRDWAHAPAPAGRAQGLTASAMAVVAGLTFAWVFLLGRPWYELAALTLLLMLPLGWWRWRVISRAPAAWPVGRLG